MYEDDLRRKGIGWLRSHSIDLLPARLDRDLEICEILRRRSARLDQECMAKARNSAATMFPHFPSLDEKRKCPKCGGETDRGSIILWGWCFKCEGKRKNNICPLCGKEEFCAGYFVGLGDHVGCSECKKKREKKK